MFLYYKKLSKFSLRILSLLILLIIYFTSIQYFNDRQISIGQYSLEKILTKYIYERSALFSYFSRLKFKYLNILKFDAKEVKYLSSNIATKHNVEIFLTGDSLMQVPENMFSFSIKLNQILKKKHSKFNIKIRTFSENYYRIHNISVGLQEIFNLRQKSSSPLPDVVFIFQNTEMNEEYNSDNLHIKRFIQINYRKSLIHITKYLSTNIKHLVLIGVPLFGLNGEMIDNWENEDDQSNKLIEQYLKINSEVCQRYSNCIHLNTRNIFKESIKEEISNGAKAKILSPKDDFNFKGILNGGGILTYDGSHLNIKGSQLLLNIVSDQLDKLQDLWDKNHINNEKGKLSDLKALLLNEEKEIDQIKLTSGPSPIAQDLNEKENKASNNAQNPLSMFYKLFGSNSKKTVDNKKVQLEDMFVKELLKDSDSFEDSAMAAELTDTNTESSHDVAQNIADGETKEDKDDRANWSAEKRSCFEWRDEYAVIVGVSWGKLPFELQQKWELYNCNDYMDCHTAACSYHSGTLDHFNRDHPVFQRPQSAADWEIANGFIPEDKVKALLLKRKQHSHHSEIVPE